jgi:ribosomal protein L30E
MAESKQAKEIAASKELLKAVEAGKIIIGTKSAMKALNSGKAARIIYANDIPEKLKAELMRNSEIAKVPAEMFPGSNMELGVRCKRAHSVLVLAIIK